MAEFTATTLQTVETNQNVLFTDTVINGNNSILHRQGSGLITLRGLCSNQCRARFKVTFGANVATPAGGTEGPISMALAINGEAVNSTIMTVTPAATEEFFNINRATDIDIPIGCCSQVSIKNVGTQSVSVEHPNIIIERVA